MFSRCDDGIVVRREGGEMGMTETERESSLKKYIIV